MEKCESTFFLIFSPFMTARVRKFPAASLHVNNSVGASNHDLCSIRLKLFTDAGFTLIPGKDNSTSKVLVRKYPPTLAPLMVSRTIRLTRWNVGNDAKSDLHTVSLDKSRSKAYNANVIWGLASD